MPNVFIRRFRYFKAAAFANKCLSNIPEKLHTLIPEYVKVLNNTIPVFVNSVFFFGQLNELFVGNKAKGRISKQVFQGNKTRQIFRKTNISYPHVRVRIRGVRNVRFLEIVAALFS